MISGCNRPIAPPASNVDAPSSPADQHQEPPSGIASQVPLAANEAVEPKTDPQPIYRPDDRRPRHDDRQIEQAGIQILQSKHLKLYTDIDLDVAQTLPSLIDQVYPVWERELGPLPPDRSGTDFQITGYLIQDMDLFRSFGLVPEELILHHGRHLRNEFWMRDQSLDYYRRHLLIHEATHCYMTFMPQVEAPVWYLEGMAECFATHRMSDGNRATFYVMPDSENAFAGFGRIAVIHDAILKKRHRSIAAVGTLDANSFRKLDGYAWSWALCIFLDRTPQYHDRFRQLADLTQSREFSTRFGQMFPTDDRNLATEWTLFTSNLQFGYDIERAAITFQPGTSLTEERSERTVDVVADHGWQSSLVRLEAGQVYEVLASGRFTLADDPKPWLSESQGITFRYFDGRPLGMLLGCIRPEEGVAGGVNEPMLTSIGLGRGAELRPTVTGTLYLRINDAWNSLHDNRGSVHVTIRRIEPH